MLNPTISLQIGNFQSFPVLSTNVDYSNNVKSNIKLSKKEWDSFETSWDFQQHPFLNHIADDKQLFSTKLLEYSYVCAKIVTTVPFGGHK